MATTPPSIRFRVLLVQLRDDGSEVQPRTDALEAGELDIPIVLSPRPSGPQYAPGVRGPLRDGGGRSGVSGRSAGSAATAALRDLAATITGAGGVVLGTTDPDAREQHTVDVDEPPERAEVWRSRDQALHDDVESPSPEHVPGRVSGSRQQGDEIETVEHEIEQSFDRNGFSEARPRGTARVTQGRPIADNPQA